METRLPGHLSWWRNFNPKKWCTSIEAINPPQMSLQWKYNFTQRYTSIETMMPDHVNRWRKLNSKKDVHSRKPEIRSKWLSERNKSSFSGIHHSKPDCQMTSTDEGIWIRRSDVHRRKPEISVKWLSDEDTISFSHGHPSKPASPITSTHEGISIR
jgi:hypothetical protein